MKLSIALTAVLLFSMAACSEPDNSVFVVKIVVLTSNKPVWDWEGTLEFKFQSNGLTDAPTGAHTKAEFTRGGRFARFDLTAHVDKDDVLALKGTCECNGPVRLVIMGSGNDGNKDDAVVIASGTGKVSYSGKLNSFFGK